MGCRADFCVLPAALPYCQLYWSKLSCMIQLCLLLIGSSSDRQRGPIHYLVTRPHKGHAVGVTIQKGRRGMNSGEKGDQKKACIYTWCHSAVRWGISGSESSERQPCLGPYSFKVLSYHKATAVRWGFVGYAKQALNDEKFAGLGYFKKIIRSVKIWVWHWWAFELMISDCNHQYTEANLGSFV